MCFSLSQESDDITASNPDRWSAAQFLKNISRHNPGFYLDVINFAKEEEDIATFEIFTEHLESLKEKVSSLLPAAVTRVLYSERVAAARAAREAKGSGSGGAGR